MNKLPVFKLNDAPSRKFGKIMLFRKEDVKTGKRNQVKNVEKGINKRHK